MRLRVLKRQYSMAGPNLSRCANPVMLASCFFSVFALITCFFLLTNSISKAAPSSDNSLRVVEGWSVYSGEQQPIFNDGVSQDVFEMLVDAVETMQIQFFELWLGSWPDGSEWTRAVFSTYISAFMHSLTVSKDYTMYHDIVQHDGLALKAASIENTINAYFGQVSAYYWSEDVLSIRTQAHDDMLWVVLEWLESIKFMNLHDQRHHNRTQKSVHRKTTWHGKQFEPVFAHRAHVLYDVVYKAWDTTTCGGGLTWDPSLDTYKNTVTNTQYISASIGMYLYHPGDDNQMPFNVTENVREGFGLPRIGPHEKKFLTTALEAYDWLINVNMTNNDGLYVDGYHISGKNGPECDKRNEMVYTYNQGILLSGLRGLWEGTGHTHYLNNGYKLIHNVIKATGWTTHQHGTLGRKGIMEEFCDASGSCSQDGQTFKGIFFHHLTLFCEPLPVNAPLIPGITYVASMEEANSHAQNCRSYVPWLRHNVRGALRSRNEAGTFGMWWGMGLNEVEDYKEPDTREESEYTHPHNAINENTVRDTGDANDRGRGRTVETQSGGLALLRAFYELSRLYE